MFNSEDADTSDFLYIKKINLQPENTRDKHDEEIEETEEAENPTVVHIYEKTCICM